MRLSLPTAAHWLAAVAALLLSACATTSEPSPAPAAADSARLYLQLSPAALGTSLSLQQHLRVERAGRTDDLDTVLEIEPDHLDLVGLAFGQRVMSLHYDGRELKTWRHFMLPKEVQGADVLQDVQLTLWPANAIRAALPAGWELRDNEMQRTLLHNQKVVTRIDYPDRKPWGGKVILTNLYYQYKLTIDSVVIAP